MACRAERDKHGTTYFIPEDKTARDPGGRKLPGLPEAQVWWSRQFKDRRDETLLIRQEHPNGKVDVVELTLGQVYDLIHACCCAVLRT